LSEIVVHPGNIEVLLQDSQTSKFKVGGSREFSVHMDDQIERRTEGWAGQRGEANKCVLGNAGLRRCRNERKYLFRNVYLADFVSYLLVNTRF
jgi:hypothetical protein